MILLLCGLSGAGKITLAGRVKKSLSKWKFNLQYYSFNKVFKQDLMQENAGIESYILDKPLIQKARYLEGRLKSFM